mmetsp:Transcript_624/g.1266  ORF Transcript_624/g.1266 Transcript_624/m.1266 type:complete len:87 (+) Transcript_624:49-309(+)
MGMATFISRHLPFSIIFFSDVFSFPYLTSTPFTPTSASLPLSNPMLPSFPSTSLVNMNVVLFHVYWNVMGVIVNVNVNVKYAKCDI